MTMSKLTIRSLEAIPLDVELAVPMRTASGRIDSSPLVAINLQTEEGVTGHAYVFCYTGLATIPVATMLQNLEPLIVGRAAAPQEIDHHLRATFRLLGDQGVVGMALAGIDMAIWDAKARAAGVPLARLLGGDVSRRINAYDSLWLLGVDEVEDVLGASREKGFRAMKIKLGNESVDTDIEVVARGRDVLGPDIKFMVDFNQSLSVPEAIRRIHMLEEFDLHWFEEPTRHSDHAGHAKIRENVSGAIQVGENWWGIPDMTASVLAGASDHVMPDLMKIGGVTGWMKAAAIGEAHGLVVSNHLFSEVSTHVMAAAPHSQLLEYLDIASNILAEPMVLEDGQAVVPARAGSGIEWDDAALARYRID
jgi:mandelate racemase